MTTLVLEPKHWFKIRQRIDADYGPLISLVSWKTKEVLGFTVRHHAGHNVWNKQYENDVRLDFVSEDQFVFFKLKYL